MLKSAELAAFGVGLRLTGLRRIQQFIPISQHPPGPGRGQRPARAVSGRPMFRHVEKAGLDIFDLVAEPRRLFEFEIACVGVHLVFEFREFGKNLVAR